MRHGSNRPARYDSEVGKRHSNKDTRRWCKGIVGRAHKPECTPYLPAPVAAQCSANHWRNLTCSACGKVLKRYWPFITWNIDGTMNPITEQKPDWVTR